MKTTDGIAIAFGSSTTNIIARPTANRVITVPNATGTLALISDIPVASRQFVETMVGAATLTLTRSPDTTRPISVFVNGQRLTREQGDLSISGQTITWLPVQAGFSLDSGDSCLVEYWA